jgi:hypothetical protein
MIMRLFRKRGEGEGSGPGKVAASEGYNGYQLLARPIKESGQWRVAGSIRAPDAGADGEGYDFVRADTMADHDECVQMCLAKARKLVDEQGSRLFQSGR